MAKLKERQVTAFRAEEQTIHARHQLLSSYHRQFCSYYGKRFCPLLSFVDDLLQLFQITGSSSCSRFFVLLVRTLLLLPIHLLSTQRLLRPNNVTEKILQ